MKDSDRSWSPGPWWLPLWALSLAVIIPPARGDVVLVWNEAMLQISATAATPAVPHLEARTYAMVHLAIDEAIASSSKENRGSETPLDGQRAAAVCAARDVLVHLIPAAARHFEALGDRHLAAIPESGSKARGIAIGQTAAAQVLQRRIADRWTDIASLNPPAGPAPDASEAAAATLVRGGELPPSPWLGAVPFALKTPQQFPAAEVGVMRRSGEVFTPVILQFPTLFNAVDREAAFASLERCWSHSPAATWNRIARQLSAARGLDLPAQARLLAALNVALADATLSTLHWRHTIGTWRMIAADLWEPLNGAPSLSTDKVARIDDGFRSEVFRVESRRVLIPPTSNYPSIAATIAGAAQAALERYFKTDQITFTLPSIPLGARSDAWAAAPPRTFASISAAARECAFLATLDGRHTREACISGYSLGSSVGNYVGKRMAARR